jgi:hypothetical protein
VPRTVKIRSPGFIQGYHLAIDNGVVRKITERLRDLWESLVEILVVPGIQGGFAAGLDPDGAVAVEFNFFCGVGRYVAPGIRFWLGDARERSPTPHNSYQRVRRNCISATSSFQCFGGTAPRTSQVASAFAFISRSTSA